MKQPAKIIIVGGTRPNFVKMAPLLYLFRLNQKRFKIRFVHTGEHYDKRLSQIFFSELAMGEPDEIYDLGTGTPAENIAKIMTQFEQTCREFRPDLVMHRGIQL
jgi:UDP-N-acetylglucosamine 2-epimerase (non-hydrolysing)